MAQHTLIVCVEDCSFAALDVKAHGGQLHHNSLVQLSYGDHMTKWSNVYAISKL